MFCDLVQRDVAIKLLQQDRLHVERRTAQREAVKHFLVEAKIMTKVRDFKFITQLYGISWIGEDNPCIVMEYLPFGSVLDHIQHNSAFLKNDRNLIRLCYHVLSGLAHLHACGFLHLDIAARNLLISGDGYIKLADFSLSKNIQSISLQKEKPVHWSAPEGN